MIVSEKYKQFLDYTIATSAAAGAVAYCFNNPLAKKVGQVAGGVFIVSTALRFCLPFEKVDVLRGAQNEIAAIPPSEGQAVVVLAQPPGDASEVDVLRRIAQSIHDMEAVIALPPNERQSVFRLALILIKQKMISEGCDGMAVASIKQTIQEVINMSPAARQALLIRVNTLQ